MWGLLWIIHRPHIVDSFRWNYAFYEQNSSYEARWHCILWIILSYEGMEVCGSRIFHNLYWEGNKNLGGMGWSEDSVGQVTWELYSTTHQKSDDITCKVVHGNLYVTFDAKLWNYSHSSHLWSFIWVEIEDRHYGLASSQPEVCRDLLTTNS